MTHRWLCKAGGVLAAIIAALSFWIPVSATALPDSAPTVQSMYVYRNLLETGDRLYLIYANIPYAVPPSTPEPDTFIWNLIDVTPTVLGATVGYNFNNSGYGYNLYSMYFPAADGLIWGAGYTARLRGNPAAFAVPPVYNYAFPASAYTVLTAQADNQAALSSTILALCHDLDERWGLTPAASLLMETDVGSALSVNGEAFIRGAIPGAQALAPGAFYTSISDVTATDRTWSDNYTTTLGGQWAGTWVATAQAGASALFGTGWDLADLMVLLVALGAVIVANMVLTGDFWGGALDAAFVLVIGTRLGAMSLGYLALVVAICVIYLGAKLWNMIPR